MVSESPKEHKYWFKSKTYGFGMTPTSLEGWLATFVLLGLILASAYANGFFDTITIPTEQVIRYLLDVTILSTLFVLLFQKQTRGELKWRWGAIEDSYDR